jgi:hypothetical protein
MEIFNLIRGHFALLIDKPLYTPTHAREFRIDGLATIESDWFIVLKISTGNKQRIYISDLLRVYTHLLSNAKHPALTQTEITNFMADYCVKSGGSSYVIPLLGTLDDIEVIREPKITIRFILPKE